MRFRPLRVVAFTAGILIVASGLQIDPAALATAAQAPYRPAVAPPLLSAARRLVTSPPVAPAPKVIDAPPKGLLRPGSPLFKAIEAKLGPAGNGFGADGSKIGGGDGGNGGVDLQEDYRADSANISVYALNGVDHLIVSTVEASNYQDREGTWHDIDTSLVQDPKTGDYSNAAGPVSVSFPPVLSDANPLTFTFDSGSLTMTPAGVVDGTKATEADNVLTYADAIPGIDLQRYATPEGYEESLVLKQVPTIDAFTWNVQATGVTLAADKDGSISILAGDQVVGTIPPANATDSAKDPAVDVFAYQLVDLQGGRYQLSVVLDKQWLTDPARVYPIGVDPAPHTTAHQASSADTYAPTVASCGQSDGGHGLEATMKVSGPATGCKDYSFVQFDLSYLHTPNVNDVVYGGYAAMHRTTTDQGAVDAYKVKGDVADNWIESGTGSLSRTIMPALDPAFSASPVCGQKDTWTPSQWWFFPGGGTGSCNTNAFDAGALVAEAFANREENNGIELRDDVSGDGSTINFDTKNNGSLFPYLVLTYNTLPDALTGAQLSCSADNAVSTTDHPKLCVNAMPSDPNSNGGDPTRVMFQVSDGLGYPSNVDDARNWTPDHVVASSPWIDCDRLSGSCISGQADMPTWMPTSGLLRDGQPYLWRAVSGDWCTDFDPGSTDDDGVCPNLDAAGYAVIRNASPARHLSVSLPHYGTDSRWAMWGTGLGNGMSLKVNQANGNLHLSYPLEALSTPAGTLGISVDYDSRRAATYGSSDYTPDQGEGPGWLISAGPLSDAVSIPAHLDVVAKSDGEGLNLLMSDGSYAHFSPIVDAGTRYSGGSGDWAGTITDNGSGSGWTYAMTSGGVFNFDSNGNLSTATASSSKWGQPGFTYSFTPAGSGSGTPNWYPRIAWVKDPMLRQVSFTWAGTSPDRLLSISTWVHCVVVVTTYCPSTSAYETWTLGYDANSPTQLNSIFDPQGQKVSFTYDSSNHYLLSTTKDGAQQGTSRDSLVTYDGSTRVSSVKKEGGNDPVTGISPAATTFAYTTGSNPGDLVNETEVTDPRGSVTSGTGLDHDFSVFTDFDVAGRPIRVLGPYLLNSSFHTIYPGSPPDPTLVPIRYTEWNAQGALLCERSPYEESAYPNGGCRTVSGGDAVSDGHETDYHYDTAPPYLLAWTQGPNDGTGTGRVQTTTSYDDGFTGLVRQAFDGMWLQGVVKDSVIDPTINFSGSADFCPAGSCTGLIYADSNNYWSAQWTGKLVVPGTGTEIYQFETLSDSGATVSIGDQGVLGCWQPTSTHTHQVLTNCGTDPNPNVFPTLQLVGGQTYPISITFNWTTSNDSHVADKPTLKLKWRLTTDASFSTIPSTAFIPNQHLATTTTQTPGPTGESSVTSAWANTTQLDELHGRPSKVTVTAGTTAQTRTTTYAYDATYGFVTDQTVKSVSQPSGGPHDLTTHSVYNTNPSVGPFCLTQLLDPTEYAAQQASQPYGHTDFTCNDAGQTISSDQFIPQVAGMSADRHRHVDTTYDDIGRVLTTTVPYDPADGTSGWGGTGKSTNVYNADGSLYSVTDPMGFITGYQYNDQGLVSILTAPDPDGGGSKASPVTYYGYDLAGNRTDVFDPDAPAHTMSTTSHHWTTVFDQENRVLTQTIPAGTSGSGSTYLVSTSYSLVSPFTTTVSTPGGTKTGGGSATITSSTSYDIAGRKISDQLGAKTANAYTYDASGALTKQVVGVVDTRLTYNAWGQAVTTVCKSCAPSSADATTYSNYDEAGRLTTTVDARASGSTDANHTWTYAFDDSGRLISSKLPSGVSFTPSSGNSRTTTFAYDAIGERVQVTDGSSRTRTFTFDDYHPAASSGSQHVETVVDPDGTLTTTNRSDLDGELIETDLPDDTTNHTGSGTHELVKRTYTYDFDGKLIQRKGKIWLAGSSTTTTESFDYDAAGNMICAATASDCTTPLISLSYDYGNRPSVLSEGSGSTAASSTYSYMNAQLDNRVDTYGSSTSSTSTFRYDDADGLLASFAWKYGSGSANTSTYTYDAYGRLSYRDDASGDRTLYSYDAHSGRVNDLKTGTPNGSGGIATTITDFARTFDAVGNVATEARTVPGYASSDAGTWNYTYDNANRITDATPPSGNAYHWEYDGAGNRTIQKIGTVSTTTSFDTNGFITAVGTSTYTNDVAGELTKIVGGLVSSTTTYTYDGFARLVEAKKVTSSTTNWDVAYTLDPLDRTTVRTNAGTNTNFSYAGTGEQLSFSVAGGSTTSYLEDGSGPIGELQASSALRYYAESEHGDVVGLIDKAAGTFVSGSNESYDPWGKVRAGATGSSIGYQADPTDPSTALVDMVSRNYATDIGRFTTQDSVFGNTLNTTSLDQFIYGNDSPATMTDPTGLSGCPDGYNCDHNGNRFNEGDGGHGDYYDGDQSHGYDYGPEWMRARRVSAPRLSRFLNPVYYFSVTADW